MKKLLLSSLLLAACGAPVVSGTDSGTDAGSDAGTDAGVDSGTPMISTPLKFAAKVGTESFACNKTFMVGSTNTVWTPKDFRFYVSNVRLLSADGGERPYTLKDDGVWQGEQVGLLDFEDAAAQCSNGGTSATNAQLSGEATGGAYTGVRFTLGLPFELNHRDATVAQAPFNSSALFWNWQGGYKFVRIDGNTTGLPNGHNVHLGSSGCINDPLMPDKVTSCAFPNRVEITLENFNLATQVVVEDYGALVKESNLDVNAAMSAPGCMSTNTDPDCATIFQNFGLPFGSSDAGVQKFFRVE